MFSEIHHTLGLILLAWYLTYCVESSPTACNEPTAQTKQVPRVYLVPYLIQTWVTLYSRCAQEGGMQASTLGHFFLPHQPAGLSGFLHIFESFVSVLATLSAAIVPSKNQCLVLSTLSCLDEGEKVMDRKRSEYRY
jgi:hypothetical protein